MRTSLLVFTAAFMVFAAAPVSAEIEIVSLRKLSKAQQEERIAGDLKAVAIYRKGLLEATAFARQQTNLFPLSKVSVTDLPRREDKELLWQTWKTYLDYLLALDAIDQYHREFFLLSGERRERSFMVGDAAFLAKYRFSLELIDAAKGNPLLDTILNEEVPEIGLAAGTYAKVKFRYLNAATAADFAARRVLYETMNDSVSEELRETMAADTDFLWKMGRGRGQLLTAGNALKIVRSAGDTAWFPVQAGVADWMGDTKVYRHGRSLISRSQIQELQPRLLPGDVLLVRHEWYLSNIGLPGFWPHAALYIGTPEERRRFFADPEVAAWVRKQGIAGDDFEELLRARSSTAYTKSLEPLETDLSIRVLEAISEGVSFTPLEHAADADSMVVLRPLLSKKEKAAALLRAFHYAGRPYDFNFNFATDAEMVCTELVFKSYEPATDLHGLQLPMTRMLGRPVLPANEIARQFDSQFGGTNAQFECVTFLDGYERQGKAKEVGAEEFRQSWRRPKWHVLVQEKGK